MDDSKTLFSTCPDGTTVITNQKISKVCVTDYTSYQVNLDIPEKPSNSLFQVYRPEREVFKLEAMNSFNGIFFLSEQNIIKVPRDFLDIECRKSMINRIIGNIYNVRRSISEPDYLLCDIRIYNPMLFADCYMGGYRKISLGYNCKYEVSYGKYENEDYQVIQKDISGNHAALISEGRRNLDFEIDKKVLEYIKL